ncbi:hypothetical protein [Bosea sp. PAMC 26642]|uniref:hypothetical protein n=1 Tax=Bosea sp. (strain PAMC 26642) TaxID=1792307 RepID=UPI00076FE4A0|nr:hypothetical protein [Bosea sp. PAMC 26642]AMJ62277.1 hypothetical protein AXW83_20000 [Bosea sp. PAMC 26642]
MTTLQEFLHGRMNELATDDASLRRKLALNEQEREQLQKAAKAAGLHLKPITEAPPPPPATYVLSVGTSQGRATTQGVGMTVSRRPIPEKTIKEAVLEVLGVLGTGLTALDLLSAINAKFDTDYPRTSLSPQLSRLKAEGKITRLGNLWSLAPDAPETNEPAHPTSEGTNERAQVPETNSTTVEPVGEVAHEKTLTVDPLE